MSYCSVKINLRRLQVLGYMIMLYCPILTIVHLHQGSVVVFIQLKQLPMLSSLLKFTY